MAASDNPSGQNFAGYHFTGYLCQYDFRYSDSGNGAHHNDWNAESTGVR